jgi:cell division control protein 6
MNSGDGSTAGDINMNEIPKKIPDYLAAFHKNIKINDKIFRDRTILEKFYIPAEIVSRDAQIKELSGCFQPIVSHSSPINAFLDGSNGTGKTICTRFVGKFMQEGLKTISEDVIDLIEINCDGINDTEVCRIIANQIGLKHDPKGYSVEESMNKIWAFINEKALSSSFYTVIFFFDEIDKFNPHKRKGNDGNNYSLEILYRISRAIDLKLVKVPNCRVGIFAASNDPDFLAKKLPPHIATSVGFNEVFFPKYNKVDLIKIMMDRIDAFQPRVIEPSLIEYIATEVADKHKGDARRALDTLLGAGKYAFDKDYNKITMECIEYAEKIINSSDLEKFINDCGKHDKYLLAAIYLVTSYIPEPTMPVVYTGYEWLCKILKIKPVSYGHASRNISTMVKTRLVDSSKGDWGNSRILSLGKEVQENIHVAYDEEIEKRVNEVALDLPIMLKEKFGNKFKNSKLDQY